MNTYKRAALYVRKRFFWLLSDKYHRMSGKPLLCQALLIQGQGRVVVGHRVQIGYEFSAGFWSTYAYFDLRGTEAQIVLGDNVILNNNASLTADDATIEIGQNTVAGINLSITTSDGHALACNKRHSDEFPRLSVSIGDNVFIGDNVMIMKGVKIGQNTVIGGGSVVVSDIPDNVVAAGNPCRILRPLVQ